MFVFTKLSSENVERENPNTSGTKSPFPKRLLHLTQRPAMGCKNSGRRSKDSQNMVKCLKFHFGVSFFEYAKSIQSMHVAHRKPNHRDLVIYIYIYIYTHIATYSRYVPYRPTTKPQIYIYINGTYRFFFGSSPPSECENITSLFSQSGFGFSRFHVFTFFTLCEFHMFHACSLQIQAVLRVFTRGCLLFTLSYVFTKRFCIFTVPLDFHGQTAFWRPYGPFGLRLPFLRSMSHLGLT